MRVRCISNDVMKLPKAYIRPLGVYSGGPNEINLTIGAIYTVYALAFCNGGVYFYVCDDFLANEPGNFPSNHGAPLFEVIDRTLSKYWCYDYDNNPYVEGISGDTAFIKPSDWVNDETLYGRLVDGDPSAEAAWLKLKNLIDEEVGEI
ncbi:MAG: hypothetical protein WCO51_09610 [bacterium]